LAGVSISDICAQDGIKPKTLYSYLLKHKVITNQYLSNEFLLAITRAGLASPECEYSFEKICPLELRSHFQTPKTHKLRNWKSDLAYPFAKCTIEIDGGVHLPGGGAHGNDREKRNAIAACGWRTLYFDTDMILENPYQCVNIVKLAIE
jgi:very-short-patch-repair endonuclease